MSKSSVLARMLGAFFFVFLSPHLSAEKLPIKSYTTADGLAHNTIMRIRRDSQGFLWFCTLRGLSRFDGYSFVSYGVEQGLPGQVTDLLETRSGDYWVATLSGLYRFNPLPRRSPPRTTHPNLAAADPPMFVQFRLTDDPTAEGINALREDEHKDIWVATNGGLYRLTNSNNAWKPDLVNIAVAEDRGNKVRVLDLFEDHNGAIWASLPGNGARRLLPSGRIDSYTPVAVGNNGIKQPIDVHTVFEDHNKQIWFGTDHGIIALSRDPYPAVLTTQRPYTTKDGLRDDNVETLFETNDGTLWVGTGAGLSEFCAGTKCGSNSFRSYTAASLGRFGVWTLADDRDGNLWIGNEVGALRLARDGFVTYDESDGFKSSRVFSVAEDSLNRLYAVSEGDRRADLNMFFENRFRSVSPRLPERHASPAPVSRQLAIQDSTGDWWVSTDYGLARYTKAKSALDLARIEPNTTYDYGRGLPFAPIIGLYPDREGNIWVGSLYISSPKGALTAWDRKSGALRVFGPAEGLTTSGAPVSFCEDDSGSLWIGFTGHDLARYHDGHFTVFTVADGLPRGSIWSIYQDHLRRVWVATTEGGAARIDDPTREHPQMKIYTTAQGLSSNQVQAITEDQWGRMYFLTDRGLDRLDLETGSVKHFSSADGLVNTSHWGVAFRDREGTLWFGTLQGLSRLKPRAVESATIPIIRIRSLRIQGRAYPVSELGESRIADVVLPPSQNDLQIEFGGFSFGVGEVLRYQYRLEDHDDDWSRPSDQRTVNYATLSPGKYRFLVRGINWRGDYSAEPAEVDFQVLSPVWRRWWFQACLLLLSAAALYSLYRVRLKRILELERVRTHIATDLHDDIGSNLTQISILSEVIRQRVGNGSQELVEPLVKIGDLSRELIDSMGDIVWSVNPKRDRVGDLVQRMRHFATELLSARNVTLEFQAQGTNPDRELRTDKRRQIFLIVKEAISNIVRHSACQRVTIHVESDKGHVFVSIGDDGKGFDPTVMNGNHGHGLQNMASRAKSLSAEFRLESHPGVGTRIALRVPL